MLDVELTDNTCRVRTNPSGARAGTDRKHTNTIFVCLFIEPHLQNLLGPGNNRKYVVPKAGNVVGPFRVRCLEFVCIRPYIQC